MNKRFKIRFLILLLNIIFLDTASGQTFDWSSEKAISAGKRILIEKSINDCSVEGNFEYASDCTKYFQCLYTVSNQYEYILYQCDPGWKYDTTALGCIQGSCFVSTTTTTARTTTTNTPSTTTTSSTTSTVPPVFQCTSEGYFADPLDCRKYYHCRKVDDTFLISHNTCAPRTKWDQPLLACVTGTCN